jgi:DnaJ-class molecular chaperone
LVSGEATVEIKERCSECGGHGWLAAQDAQGGHYQAHEPERTCPRCQGDGYFTRDVPLSEFRELLEQSNR